MSLALHYWNEFHRLLDKHADKRSTNWFLMGSPFTTAAICLSYVYIVKVAGPRFMENRKPLELRKILIVYNLFQVLFSTWLFYECLMGGWWGEYSLRCQPVDYSDSPTATRIGMSGWFTGRYNFQCQPVDYSDHPTAIRMVHASWWYFFSKFTEFFDTFFFVLRKKNQHVSTLHVIHHGIMPFSVWFGVKFTPGGHSTFFGLLNTFVHIIMYTYYMLAAIGPQVQKYLWWKKYITALQMAQFVAIMIHAFQLLFIDCNYPRAFVWWIGMHAVMFWFLFKEFYDQSYRKPRAAAKAKAAAAAAALAANGHATTLNHKANGTVTTASKPANGIANGSANGHSLSNGVTNGSLNGTTANGKHRAADYYINGDIASEIHYRHNANGKATNSSS